jgi:hypothetical protein
MKILSQHNQSHDRDFILGPLERKGRLHNRVVTSGFKFLGLIIVITITGFVIVSARLSMGLYKHHA